MPSGNNHTIRNRQPHNEVNIHERINRCNTGKWNSIIIVDIQWVIWHNILVLSQYFNFSQIKKKFNLILIHTYVYLLTCTEVKLEEFCSFLEFEGEFHALAYSCP